MKQVDLYEVSRKVQATELDWVEFHQYQPLPVGFSPVLDDYSLEPAATFVRHSEPVVRLRRPDGSDVFVAIGPELKELLLVALEAPEVERLRGRLAEAKRELGSTRDQLEIAEAGRLSLHQRVWNFSGANVFTRIWRAIRRAM